MALIVGKEQVRVLESDEIGQTARMLRKLRAEEAEKRMREEAEKAKKAEAESVKPDAESLAVSDEKPSDAEDNGRAEEAEKSAPSDDKGKDEGSAEKTEAPSHLSGVIDGSQIKAAPKKKTTRKNK